MIEVDQTRSLTSRSQSIAVLWTYITLVSKFVQLTINGYAGLSALLFIINLTVYNLATHEFILAVLVSYVFMHISLLTLPALYIHSRMDHMWLRKNLPKARRFTKSDVRILEE